MESHPPVINPDQKTFGTLLIEQEVERNGPMNFEAFTSLALYHPRYGYYNQRFDQRGRRGDYFTSLQVSDLFPKIFSDAIVEMKRALQTDQFSLVEWGSGAGEFLLAVLQSLDEKKELKGMRIWAVETGRPAREKLARQLSRFPKCRIVSSLDEIEAPGGLEGCFFSNEFFDSLPFRRLRFTSSGWREIFVSISDGQLAECEFAFHNPDLLVKHGLDQLEFEEGQEIEIRPLASRWIENWGNIFARGFMVTVDYGGPRALLYSPKRMKGTWQCFSAHQSNQHPLEKIGKQDITAHADFTQLVQAGRSVGLEPIHFSSQGIFLSFMGQQRIEEFLRQSNQDEQKIKIGQLQQLIHPDAMGEAFWVLVQSKEAPLPEKIRSIPNRLKRLI